MINILTTAQDSNHIEILNQIDEISESTLDSVLQNIEDRASKLSNSNLDSCIQYCENAIRQIPRNNQTLSSVARIHTKLSICQKNKGDFEKAVININKAINLAKKLDHKKMELTFQTWYSSIQIDMEKYKEAKTNLNKILEKNSNTINSGYINAISYNELGLLEYRRQQFFNATKNYLKAMQFKDSCDLSTLHNIRSGLAFSYLNGGDEIKAANLFLKNYKDAKKDEKKCSMMINLKNAALSYRRIDSLKKSLHYNVMAEKLEKHCGALMQFDLSVNMTTLFKSMENTKKQLEYAQKTYELSKKLSQRTYKAFAICKLANAYAHNKNIQDASFYLNKIKQLYNDIDNIGFNLLKLEAEYLIHKYNQNFSEALISHEKLVEFKDSIENIRKKSDIKILNQEYEITKKENENLQLKQQKQAQELKTVKANRQRSLLGVGFGATALLGGLAFVSYRKSNQQKKRIERLQRELHHRMKNNLAIVDVFLETTESEMNDHEVSMLLRELRNRINSIAHVHELLVDNKDVTNLNIHQYINELVNNIKETNNNENISFQLDVPENIPMESTKTFPVGLIVNEFITNSVKYAFPNNKDGVIKIRFREINDSYQLMLQDNGVGLPEHFSIQNTDSFGMKIMLLLTKQLDGRFDLKSDKGVKINIEFP